MLEERKQKEIEYYDKEAEDFYKGVTKEAGSRGGFNPFELSSYNFLRNYLKDKIHGKKILDYGCGSGVHSIWLAEYGAKVVGIDLSTKSLTVAKEKVEKAGLSNNAEFLSMDCEKMQFSDNFFDIIFDGGTFSSLDLDKAFPELARVLKADGYLIGIETLGHNPLTNFKREINKLTGKRTEWAASHIFQMKDLEKAKKYFNKTEVYFFHIISWFAFPFLNLPGGKFLLNFLEDIDEALLTPPLFRKYAFKLVFIFSQPKKL
jgi:ubiquinone/menaquinone biosynthesis C-methylase UbiE